MKRSAPSALRNREPIAEVLQGWLPERGTVLEIASGTGEHAAFFAERFPSLDWQPSDVDEAALVSIRAWSDASGCPNLREPMLLDSAKPWPQLEVAALLCINMAHISPWEATLGVLDGARRLLPRGGALIFYGPWLADDIITAPSNLAFDAQLRDRNPSWGLRTVEQLADAALTRGLKVVERRMMPANNMMLLLRQI